MGWSDPLDTRTLAVQLREVARAYTVLEVKYTAQLNGVNVDDGLVKRESISGEKEGNRGREKESEGGSRGDVPDEMTTESRKDSSTVDVPRQDIITQEIFQESKERITTLVPYLYQRINAVCGGGVGEGRDEILLEELQGQKWIWVGESFVTPSRVAFESTVNATPYLYQLPQDLKVCGKLLGSFGIKRCFTPRDYIQVLREMYESSCIVKQSPEGSKLDAESDNSVVTSPLSDAKLDLAVSLVTLLSTEGNFDANVHTIYAPDSTDRLAHSTTLVNDDVPWLSGPEYASTRIGSRLIHPNISSSVALKLGQSSTRIYCDTVLLDPFNCVTYFPLLSYALFCLLYVLLIFLIFSVYLILSYFIC